MLQLLYLFILYLPIVLTQDNAADFEFSPYVFKHVDIPFKSRSVPNGRGKKLGWNENNYAKDWFGSDVALVQHPFLAAAKAVKPGNPVSLPTIAPLVVKWSNLDNLKVNEKIGLNFERRVDSHVWWPNK